MNIPNGLSDYTDPTIESFLILDEQKYEIQGFQILFSQGVDFKGQPQSETRGGQFSLSLLQAVDDNIYEWAKRTNSLKTGAIQFVSETSGTILEIVFTDAACISLTHKVNAFSGIETMLVVSPSLISMYGITHDNRWTK